jgi:fluoride exporter
VTVLLIALAGGLGAVARFVLDGVVTGAVSPWLGERFRGHPVAITLINLSGSFLLGLLAGLAAGRVLDDDAVLVLGTGFLGGYTTFSTAAYETVRLLEQRRWGAALLHGVGQVVAATVLAALGFLAGS